MLAKSFILAALVGMASAGFLEGPAVVAPGYARYTAPAYYSSPIAYHAPLAYHAPIAVSAAPAAKAEAPPAKEVAPTKAAVTAAEDDVDYDPNPSYSFSYDVKDEETGDTKTQSESLENGVVKGSYTVVDPDGTKRTVEYTADAVNGFKAVVNMEPSDVVIKAPASKVPAPAPAPASAPAPAPSPAPAAPAKAAVVTAAAPAFYHAPHLAYHAPLAYHTPVAKVLSVPVSKVVQFPLSYSTSHVYHPSTVTYATAPVHHKFIYA